MRQTGARKERGVSSQPSLPPRRFRMHELVVMPRRGAAYVTRVRGHEDGRNLGCEFAGWAYHVQIAGNDSRAARRVIVAEGKLRKLTEE